MFSLGFVQEKRQCNLLEHAVSITKETFLYLIRIYFQDFLLKGQSEHAAVRPVQEGRVNVFLRYFLSHTCVPHCTYSGYIQIIHVFENVLMYTMLNGSSGRLHRKGTAVGSSRLQTFVLGALIGALLTWMMVFTIHEPLPNRSQSMKDNIFDPEDDSVADGIGKNDVLPSSLTIRGHEGYLCKDCEKALSRIQEEIRVTETDLKICLDEAIRRDEEEFDLEDPPEKDVDAFVGIQTGYTSEHEKGTDYDYEIRRKTIRETWFRSQDETLISLLEKHRIVVKFVVGYHPYSKEENARMVKEIDKHEDILRINIEEQYNNLVEKSREFFNVVMRKYNPKYIIKVDDDVYVKLNRLPSLISQWSANDVDYTGCMKTGPIQSDKRYKWYEEQHALLGDKSYFAHTWGSMYVLSNHAANAMLEIKKENLRYLANEDVTIGMWMMALKMKHFDDRRLCESRCGTTGVGLIDLPNPGLTPVVKRMKEIHDSPDCKLDQDMFEIEIVEVGSLINFDP